jgi:hypothetical protein
MTMQTDVKSIHLSASGVVFGGRCRIRGYQLAPSGTAGQFDFYDNPTTNSGVIKLSVDVTTNTAVISTNIAGEGILFEKGCYVVIPSGSITIFYS